MHCCYHGFFLVALLTNVAIGRRQAQYHPGDGGTTRGGGDMAYNGHPELKTPNFDAAAATGLRFDRFYAAAPVCSPTRASVIDGATSQPLRSVQVGISDPPPGNNHRRGA